MMRALRAALTVFVALFALGGAAATVASAQTALEPWFHLTSEARPTNLAPASLKVDERQEVTVAAKKGSFYLEDPETHANDKSSPLPFDAKAAQVQAVLEGFYGAGEVEVPSGEGDKEGTDPYVIVFVGKRSYHPVQLVVAESSSLTEGFEPLEGGKLDGRKVLGEQAIDAVQAVEGAFHGSELAVAAINVGSASANAGADPIELTDVLPAHVRAVFVEGNTRNQGSGEIGPIACELTGGGATCTFKEGCTPYEGCLHRENTLPPFFQIEMVVAVEVEPGAETGELNEVLASGGGAPAAHYQHALSISNAPAPYGVETYEPVLEEVGGGVDDQAGSHPFQFTTTFALNTHVNIRDGEYGVEQPVPATLPKDVAVKLPPGLIGNPTAYPRCTLVRFSHEDCPSSTVVGVASATFANPANRDRYGLNTGTAPIYNLETSPGEPARFGFQVGPAFVLLDAHVRSGGDYGVTADVENVAQNVGFLENTVTFWGTPGDPAHNSVRGLGCVELFDSEPGKELHQCEPEDASSPAFFTLPTYCPGSPLVSETETDSWADVGVMVSPLPDPTEPMPAVQGCALLPAFEPQIGVAPEKHAGSSPSAMAVSVHIPEPDGRLAESQLRSSVVTLPAGVQVNPSSANGLEACSETQAGFEGFASNGEQRFSPGAASCPDASKLGVARVKTPLLPNELKGGLYLAEPAPNGEAGKNPFNSLVAVYLVVEDPVSGVIVKFAGEGKLDPSTGQVTTTFLNTAQAAFEELNVELLGGERAPLSTPAHCGSYGGQATFTPWSGTEPVNVSSPSGEFTIGEDCANGALGFSPGFLAKSTDPTAGAFSQFQMEIVRPDGQQALNGLSIHLPAGVAAVLSSVTPCAEPPAGVEWSCGPESLIGHSTAAAGLGNDPVTQEGEVYLTSGYDGAPFGILARTPAVAGPFNLGWVNVRARIEVDPNTAAVTVTTDPGPHGDSLPTRLRGIPVQLKDLQVKVDRPGFQFNPTNCNATSVTGSLSGDEGAQASVSSHFQVGGCEHLPFTPNLSASVTGQASKANGTAFTVKVTSAGLGQANIQKVALQLPAQLPSRLSTIQKACPQRCSKRTPPPVMKGR